MYRPHATLPQDKHAYKQTKVVDFTALLLYYNGTGIVYITMLETTATSP